MSEDIPNGRAQDEGMVPESTLEPRLSWDKEERELQAVGNVPVIWLLAMLRVVRRVKVDQAARREPLKELPGSWIVWREVIELRSEGSVPVRPWLLRSKPVTDDEVQVTPLHPEEQGSAENGVHVPRAALDGLAMSNCWPT